MLSPAFAQLLVQSHPAQVFQRGLNILENNRRQPIKQNLSTGSAKPCKDPSQKLFSPLDVPVQVPDATKRSPDISRLFGEEMCFLRGSSSQEQTAPVPCLQAIRGWDERAEQH